MAGRAPNLPRRPRRPDQGVLKNEIAADYCFLSSAARDVSQPVLVAAIGVQASTSRMPYLSKEQVVDHQADFAGLAKVWVPRQSRTQDGWRACDLDLMGEVARLGDLPTMQEHGNPRRQQE